MRPKTGQNYRQLALIIRIRKLAECFDQMPDQINKLMEEVANLQAWAQLELNQMAARLVAQRLTPELFKVIVTHAHSSRTDSLAELAASIFQPQESEYLRSEL